MDSGDTNQCIYGILEIQMNAIMGFWGYKSMQLLNSGDRNQLNYGNLEIQIGAIMGFQT